MHISDGNFIASVVVILICWEAGKAVLRWACGLEEGLWNE